MQHDRPDLTLQKLFREHAATDSAPTRSRLLQANLTGQDPNFVEPFKPIRTNLS